MVPQSITSSYDHLIHFREISANIEEKGATAVHQSCSRYFLSWGNHQQLSSAVFGSAEVQG